jgi:hypothetical protein
VQAEAAPSPKAYEPGVRVDAADTGRDDYYGWSVAASADTMLVGMPFEFTGTTLTPGAAYLRRRQSGSWTQEAKLAAADGVSFDYFGEAVALDGDLAAVAAPSHQSGRGAVYLFQRQNGSWSQVAKLLASDPTPNASFGQALALNAGTLAVGAPGYNGGRGAVYVFVGAGGSWSQQQRIQSNDISANDRFGQAVALSGQTLLIGAPNKAGSVSAQGVAYLFGRSGSTWSQQARLARTSPQAGEGFGAAVALDLNLAAVGAPYAPAATGTAGGLVQSYLRTGSTWSPLAELRSAQGSASAQFGFALSLSGQRLLVGLAGDSFGEGILQGSLEAYLFESGVWGLNQRMVAADAETEAQLGYSVAQGADFAAAGAPGASRAGQVYVGAAYAFINRGTSTAVLPISGQPIRIGESYVVGAAVSSTEVIPTGTVNIRDDAGGNCTATLSNGAGTCTLLANAVGLRALSARYNGAPGIAESFATATVQVKPDLRISPASLPDGQIGAAYAQFFNSVATGATLPLSYSLASGSLPPGLSLGSNGSLSGTASSFGSFSFSVRLTDSSPVNLGGPFAETRAYALTIQPPFRTGLILVNDATSADRGQSVAYASLLDVVEAGAAAPSGSYVVTATRGAQVLSCSATVSAEGTQSCSITFPLLASVGDYVIAAQFNSTNADYGNSRDSGTHRLLAPADPAVQVQALDSTFLPGQTLRFRINISNGGPDSAFALQLQSSLDSALSSLVWTCSGSACPAPGGSGTPNLLISELAAGGQLSLELSGVVGANAPASITLAAQLNLQPEGFSRELDSGNNSASAGSLPLRLFADGFETPEP